MVWIEPEYEFTYLPTVESAVLILIYDSRIYAKCVKTHNFPDSMFLLRCPYSCRVVAGQTGH